MEPDSKHSNETIFVLGDQFYLLNLSAQLKLTYISLSSGTPKAGCSIKHGSEHITAYIWSWLSKTSQHTAIMLCTSEIDPYRKESPSWVKLQTFVITLWEEGVTHRQWEWLTVQPLAYEIISEPLGMLSLMVVQNMMQSFGIRWEGMTTEMYICNVLVSVYIIVLTMNDKIGYIWYKGWKLLIFKELS